MISFWRNIFTCFVLAVASVSSAWAEDESYRIGVGDVLRITVYGQPDLATEAKVNEKGSIAFPLVGYIPLSGISPAQAEAEIAQRLMKGGFIIEPFVSLTVLQFRSQQISVLGRIARPGKYPLERTSRITDALAMAGGPVGDAGDSITLVRKAKDTVEYREIDLVKLFKMGGETINEQVQDGDIIYVIRQPAFYIYGEVQRPGTFRLEQNMNVVQALSMGGGLTPRGTQKGIKILRRDSQGVLNQIDASLSDPVKQDDVIYVKESLF
jgi:polysaccharide export outer membrane protein